MPPSSPPGAGPSESVLRHRRVLFGIAAFAMVLLFGVYLCAVRTPWGQRLDATAIRGRLVLSRHDIRVAARLHTTIDIASVALLGGAVVLVAFLRGRRRLMLGVGVLMVGSLATTETLKRVLGRPRLAATDPLRYLPTFPSGHTTIAMALSVGALFVAPRRYRTAVAVAGVVFAAAVGCSVVVTASHRPSDAIGATLVVTAWAAVIAAFLLRAEPSRAGRPAWLRLSPWMALAGISLLSAAFVIVVVVALAIHQGRLDAIEIGHAFVGAASAIVGTILLCVATLLIALHDVDLDRPGRGRAETRTPAAVTAS